VVEVDEGIALPKPVAKIISRDDLPRFLQKDREDLEGLFGKLKTHPVLAKFGRL